MNYVPNNYISFTPSHLKYEPVTHIPKNLTIEKVISKFVEADCWAVLVNDEIVFNSYDPNLSVRKKICNDLVRMAIIDDPHRSLLCDIFRRGNNASIEICMFETGSWSVTIDYKKDKDLFEVTYHKSDDYV